MDVEGKRASHHVADGARLWGHHLAGVAFGKEVAKR
jgi:hypothetical protein